MKPLDIVDSAEIYDMPSFISWASENGIDGFSGRDKRGAWGAVLNKDAYQKVRLPKRRKPGEFSTANKATTQPPTNMEDNQTKPDPIAELKAAVEALSARLSKLETPPAPASAPADEKKEDMSAKLGEVAELAAQNALKAFAAQFGTPPAPASAAKETVGDAKPAEKKFEELVREHPDYAKSKRTALDAVISANPAAYADYNQRVRSGEVIMF